MGDPTKTLSTHDAAWLAETFRRNRERFAGWRMEAGSPAPPADPSPAPEPTPDPAPAPPPEDGKGGKDAVLADLAKERDKRQALEQTVAELQAAQQTQLDAIAKALGLKADDTPPDPEKLAEQITAAQGETASVTAERDDALRQLAVFRLAAAGKHEGNPIGLIDSATFLRSLADVDPSDESALTAAIKAAVEANPTLKAASPTPSFPGGPRKTSTQPDPGPGLPRLRNAYAQSSQ